MDVNNISVFLNCIEPNIKDINRVKLYLDQTNREYDELENLINYVDGDSKKIINYENQSIVYNYLKNISMDAKNYDAIKYLISNDGVKEMPQWIKAKQSLDSLLDSLINRKQEISNRVDVLSFAYTEKYIAKRYYDMASKKDFDINDPDMFMKFLDRLELTDDIKINILKEAIRDTNKNHRKNIYNIYTNALLEEYKELLTNKYISMIDNVNKYIDLSKNIDDLLELKQNDYNEENLVLIKKIWLVNELNKTNSEERKERLSKELIDLVRYKE